MRLSKLANFLSSAGRHNFPESVKSQVPRIFRFWHNSSIRNALHNSSRVWTGRNIPSSRRSLLTPGSHKEGQNEAPIFARNAAAEMADIERAVLNHIEPVECPLVLVSQIPRSGGTLLSQLFDGHPQIYAFHAQFHAIKKRWPKLQEEASSREKFAEFYDKRHLRMFLEGYRRGTNIETKMFLLPPSLQEKVFSYVLENYTKPTQRDIFNAYMTSYFQGWLNNLQPSEGKKYISAFTARMATNETLVQKFFEIYPDGFLIQNLRHPTNWFASYASMLDWGEELRKKNITKSIQEWRDSAIAIIRNRKEYREKVIAIRFESLIRNSETTMRQISQKIGIVFDSCLTVPTFNKAAFSSNTYFGQPASGRIDSGVAERKTSLSDEEISYIEKTAMDDYSRALEYITVSEN